MINPPYLIAQLVKVAGLDPVLRLVEAKGGQRLWVPVSAPGSQLANLYGDAIARSLCAAYPGELVKLPMARAWRAHCYRERGLTISDIALHLGSDRSTIQRLLRTEGAEDAEPTRAAALTIRNDPAQLDLFKQ